MFQGAQPIIDLPTLNFAHLPKIALLIVIILYAIFSLMIYVKVRALTKIVIFQSTRYSSIPMIALIYFFLIVSLFSLALVIV